MKTNRLFITAAIIIAGSFFVDISAQDALKAIAKKCEAMDNVDISVVRNRNKETKKVDQYIMSITFEKNESLKKEILAAFDKERVNADQEIEDRKDGRVRSMMLRFGSSLYSISENPNGRVSFSVNEDNGSKDGAFIHNGFYFNSARPHQARIDIAKQTINSVDWDDISANLKGLENLEIEIKNFEKYAKNFEEKKRNLEVDNLKQKSKTRR